MRDKLSGYGAAIQGGRPAQETKTGHHAPPAVVQPESPGVSLTQADHDHAALGAYQKLLDRSDQEGRSLSNLAAYLLESAMGGQQLGSRS